jgi:hypothetical protein
MRYLRSMELLRSAQGDERPKKATLHRENRGGRKQSVRSSRSEKHARLDISLGTPVPVVTAGPPVLLLLSLFVTRQVTRDNSASLLVGIYVLNRGGLARPVGQRGMQSQSAPHRVWVYVCERATPNAGDGDGLMSVCWSLDRHGYDLRKRSRRVCSTE